MRLNTCLVPLWNNLGHYRASASEASDAAQISAYDDQKPTSDSVHVRGTGKPPIQIDVVVTCTQYLSKCWISMPQALLPNKAYRLVRGENDLSSQTHLFAAGAPL